MNSLLISVPLVQKVILTRAKCFCLVLAITLTGCFEHDTPFNTVGNKTPESQLLGVWKERSLPGYYQFEKIDDSTLKITSSAFDLENPDSPPTINEERAIIYTMNSQSILVSQLRKSNKENDSLMKWGYFPYVLSGDGGTLQLYYLSVPKNGDIEAVRKSLADRKDPTPVSTFEKINLPSLPTSIPAGHLLEYKLAAKTREIEALKNKVSALEKVPPNPVSVEKPAALFSQPIPVVTNHKIVEDAWIVNGEFDYGAKVSFDVTNIGEAGVIEVAVNLTSSEGNWVRKEKRYFEKGEKKNLSGVFTEITVESKNIQYKINCTK